MYYCENCGKLQTDIEILNNQCNDCDPFMDAFELELLYGEPEYK